MVIKTDAHLHIFSEQTGRKHQATTQKALETYFYSSKNPEK